MLTISQQQAGQRWDILTPPLREALFSDVNGDFVWKLCQDEHLSEEKCYQVGELAGYVLYGFLHPEDLSDELTKSLGLPAPLSKTIASAISARIFTPLRGDIDKVYAPISKAQPAAAPKGTEPKIVQDIGPSKTIAPVTLANTPLPVNKMAPTPQQPSPVSDAGWSRASSAGPGVKLSAVSGTPSPAEPAPVMLHEDTTFKAAEKNANFTFSQPGSGAEMRMNQNVTPVPTRPAVLEFGSTNASAPTQPAPASSSVSHSNEFKLSLSSVPTADTGPRSVNQITGAPPTPKPPSPPSSPASSVPKPPAPPSAPASSMAVPVPKPATPSAAPKPPQAPAPQPSQTSKPIVRDFL